jgi:hypothetical protein
VSYQAAVTQQRVSHKIHMIGLQARELDVQHTNTGIFFFPPNGKIQFLCKCFGQHSLIFNKFIRLPPQWKDLES